MPESGSTPPTARLTLKVPEKYLDAVINTISQTTAFISYRIRKEDDRSLQINPETHLEIKQW